MKIIFAGTPDFALPSLRALLDSEHEIVAVYTQPDRPAGRGRKLTASPVKQLALENHIPVHQPPTLKDSIAQQQLANLHADLMVVIAYGLLLPQAVLDIPKHGCINVHGSLLPRWRGAAPIQRAIIAGDKTTGITIMQMDAGLDTGDMLAMRVCDIDIDDTSQDMHDRLSEMGATLLLDVIDQIANDALKPIKQDDAKATYAKKITKAEAEIDWTQSAQQIVQRIHGFNPWPGSVTRFNDQVLKVWQAQVVECETSTTPGMVINKDKVLDIAAGKNAVRLVAVQLAGGKRITAQDLLNAHRDIDRFD